MANNQDDLLVLVDEKIIQAHELLENCELLILKRIEGSEKLKRKVQAELDFLNHLKQRPSTLRPNHMTSTNLTHLNAFFDAAANLTDVVAILAPFPRQDDKRSNLLVDVVADGGSTWIKVVARSARGLHFAWAGEAGYQERGIVDQVSDYCATAKNNPHMYKPPKILILFCAGVTQPILDDLKRRFQIESRGDIVPVDPCWGLPEDDSDASENDKHMENGDEIGRDESSIEHQEHDESALLDPSSFASHEIPLNLDITVLIAYVSALTNGSGAQYRFKEPLLDEQAGWERERPALPGLQKFMDPGSGRQLLCCATAYKSFIEILNMVGGEGEKERANSLLKRVKLVDDCLSERAAKLQLGGKIKDRSKTIFGSGDYYQAVTLTANRGFVHAAANQGIRFAVIFHESRALSEQKQQHAVPFEETIRCDTDCEKYGI